MCARDFSLAAREAAEWHVRGEGEDCWREGWRLARVAGAPNTRAKRNPRGFPVGSSRVMCSAEQSMLTAAECWRTDCFLWKFQKTTNNFSYHSEIKLDKAFPNLTSKYDSRKSLPWRVQTCFSGKILFNGREFAFFCLFFPVLWIHC